MLFNSLSFVLFFSLVVVAFFSLSSPIRPLFLLLASYFYYFMWEPKYVLLLIALSICTYVLTEKMKTSPKKELRSWYLAASIGISVSSLFFFKYFNFFNESSSKLFSILNLNYSIEPFDIILPVGVSFFTFKMISYAVDTYRNDLKEKTALSHYLLYVSFFPQILAGPIERATHILPQFKKEVTFDYDRVKNGILLFSWGLFKKVVVADRVAIVVNNIYSNPTQFQGIPLLIATALFSYQIYCDFSGYSDMAIGASQILGYNSKINFNRPYFAKTTGEFWRRWHISLSTWFRDYLYIPLGGNRTSIGRWSLAILIVFLVSGLWHGAAWTFAAWGCLHGIYLLGGRFTKTIRNKLFKIFNIGENTFLRKAIKIGTTYLLVSFAWIFFRANNFNDAIYICLNMFVGVGDFFMHIRDTAYIRSIIGQLGSSQSELIIALCSIAILEAIQIIQEFPTVWARCSNLPTWSRWICYYLLAIFIIFFGAFNSVQDFIYLQF